MVVLFDPEVQSLQQFLHTWPPSTTDNPRVDWTYVQNAAAVEVEVEGDSDGLTAAWSSICLSRNNVVTAADLDALALEYNVLCGKWLIFSTSSSVDMDWTKVCQFFDNRTLSDFMQLLG